MHYSNMEKYGMPLNGRGNARCCTQIGKWLEKIKIESLCDRVIVFLEIHPEKLKIKNPMNVYK